MVSPHVVNGSTNIYFGRSHLNLVIDAHQTYNAKVATVRAIDVKHYMVLSLTNAVIVLEKLF